MRISARELQRFCAETPGDAAELKDLLDDLGLEVKRLEEESNDILITLELLANRGDHYCYQGVAREIAARKMSALRLPPIASVDVGDSPLELRIESELCTRYSLTPFEAVEGSRAALNSNEKWILEAARVYTGHPLVDVTNLVNLEFGQPTHAFDFDKIAGSVSVRLSKKGERAYLLFATDARELPEGTLVIADDEKILAVAGVIGGEESKVTTHTKRMLLESAAFDPVAVRKASRALGIHTDSSARFERGSDPTMVLVAIGRVAQVLESLDLAQRTGATVLTGTWCDPSRVIGFDIEECQAFFQRAFDASEVVNRLDRYGFRHQGDMNFVVPPHRLWDVENQVDLFEELARSVGLNSFPESLPPVSLGALPSDREVANNEVDQLLTANGFYEVYTDGFYSRQVRQQLGLQEHDPLWAHVETQNAVDKGYSLLKNNCLSQALDAVAYNIRFKASNLRLYEWTRTFHPDSTAENGVCNERHMLWAIGAGLERPDQWDDSGRHVDFFLLKGLLEEIREILKVPFQLTGPDAAYFLANKLHPHRSGVITLNDEQVGALGEVHPEVVRAFGIRNCQPVYFEIESSALLGPKRKPRFRLPPQIPEIERMLCFVAPVEVSIKEMTSLMRSGAPDWLDRISVADVYAKTGGERSVTFRLEFDAETPRTTEQLNAACESIVAEIASVLEPRGVFLR